MNSYSALRTLKNKPSRRKIMRDIKLRRSMSRLCKNLAAQIFSHPGGVLSKLTKEE